MRIYHVPAKVHYSETKIIADLARGHWCVLLRMNVEKCHFHQ